MAKKTDSLTNERKWSETKSACVECSEISTNVSCAGNRFSVYLLSIAFSRPERHSPETKQAMFFSLSNEYTMCWFTSVMTWGFILFEFLYLDGKQISWKNNQRQSAIACSIFLLASIFIPCAALLKVHMHFRKIQNVSREYTVFLNHINTERYIFVEVCLRICIKYAKCKLHMCKTVILFLLKNVWSDEWFFKRKSDLLQASHWHAWKLHQQEDASSYTHMYYKTQRKHQSLTISDI